MRTVSEAFPVTFEACASKPASFAHSSLLFMRRRSISSLASRSLPIFRFGAGYFAPQMVLLGGVNLEGVPFFSEHEGGGVPCRVAFIVRYAGTEAYLKYEIGVGRARLKACALQNRVVHNGFFKEQTRFFFADTVKSKNFHHTYGIDIEAERFFYFFRNSASYRVLLIFLDTNFQT